MPGSPSCSRYIRETGMTRPVNLPAVTCRVRRSLVLPRELYQVLFRPGGRPNSAGPIHFPAWTAFLGECSLVLIRQVELAGFHPNAIVGAAVTRLRQPPSCCGRRLEALRPGVVPSAPGLSHFKDAKGRLEAIPLLVIDARVGSLERHETAIPSCADRRHCGQKAGEVGGHDARLRFVHGRRFFPCSLAVAQRQLPGS